MSKFFKYFVLLFFYLTSINIFSQQTEKKETNKLFNKTDAQQLEKQLEIEEKKLQENSNKHQKKYDLYRALAITGYTLSGIGVGLIIIDSMAVTKDESDSDPDRFGNLTWSGIPILLSGTIMAITCHLLQKEEEERRILAESDLFDIKGELNLLRLQLYGTEKNDSLIIPKN